MHGGGNHVRVREGHPLNRNEAGTDVGAAGHVDLDGDSFAFDERPYAADLIEHLLQCREHPGAVGVATGQRDGRRGGLRGPCRSRQQRRTRHRQT